MPYRNQVDAMAARIEDLERQLGEMQEDLARMRKNHSRAMQVLRMMAEKRKVTEVLDRLLRSSTVPPPPEGPDPA